MWAISSVGLVRLGGRNIISDLSLGPSGTTATIYEMWAISSVG